MKSAGKNIVSLIIIVCTFLLFWVIFVSPKGSFSDPYELVENLRLFLFFLLNSPLLILFLILILVIIFYDPLIFIIFKPLLNRCKHCLEIRNDKIGYLVNGYCSSCKEHLCIKCFKEKSRCPACGGVSFTHKKYMGYIKLPTPIIKLLFYSDFTEEDKDV